MIIITDRAIEFFRKQLEKNDITTAEGGIRIGIKAGGCSGFEYFFKPVAKHDNGDHVMLFHGIYFYVDPKSMTKLTGTEIDYARSDNLLEGLVFKNPHAKSSCGCGISFELK